LFGTHHVYQEARFYTHTFILSDEVYGDNHSITEGDASQTLSKKRRYSSSRDFYEPPDDYYEHLPLDITLEDMERRLRFPPVVVIPTAPRAMLAAAAASAALASQAAATYQSSTADQGNSYYATSADVYSAANDQHGYDTPRSGTALPLDDSTLPTAPAAMQAYTALNRSQSSRYSSPSTDIPTQPAAFTAAASAVAASTSTDHIKLPPNWKAAYSVDGSLYYYNILTNQSQWEPPEGKVSSIEGVDQNQIENLVATAIMDAERKKKTTVTSSEADVKRPSRTSTKAYTTSISKSESTVKAMSEVELKKEVRPTRIVTAKYLIMFYNININLAMK
jgi:WW domain